MSAPLLKGKTLFITGASRGIGLAIALRAARDGANIVIAAKTGQPDPRLPGTIHTAAEEIERVGGKALAVQCDIRFVDQIEAAVRQAADRFGGIDICVNNASAIDLSPTLDTSEKRYDLMHQINGRGTFFVTQKCLPYLLEAKNPHVLNISPPLDYAPRHFAPYPAYALAKYSMSIYAMAMAAEFRSRKVAFNTLWPRSTIATAAVRNVLGGEEMIQASRTPDILADAAYLILTKDSAEFTGNHCMDDVLLEQHGITDLRPYRLVPGTAKLADDFFLPDSMPVPEGLQI